MPSTKLNRLLIAQKVMAMGANINSPCKKNWINLLYPEDFFMSSYLEVIYLLKFKNLLINESQFKPTLIF
jgi:hypothetical protein